jgi:xylulokinase
LHTEASRGSLFRAVLEGLALETRVVAEPLLAHAGLSRLTKSRAIGGVTNNELLMRIRATARDQPIEVLDVGEATSLGAAMLGGLAAGIYPDVPSAIGAMRYGRKTVAPDRALLPFYEALYERVFTKLYPALAPLSHELVALLEGESTGADAGAAG